MKKLKLVLLAILFLVCMFSAFEIATGQTDSNSSDIENLTNTINQMLDNLNLYEYENYLDCLPEYLNVEGDSYREVIFNLISGSLDMDYESLLEQLLSTLLVGLTEKLPIFITLFCLIVISSLIGKLKPNLSSKSLSSIINFINVLIITGIVASLLIEVVNFSGETIEKLTVQMQGVFPLMLTIMTVVGGTTSIAIYNPAILFVINFISIVISQVLFPIVTLMIIIIIVNSLSSDVKLEGLYNFLASTLKWVLGFIIAIFSIFISIQGLTASMYDGIHLRAIKYAVNSSIPLVGGLIKDGLDLILASAVLIKNAIGLFAILAILGIVIEPILEIISIILLFKLLIAVSGSLMSKEISKMLNGIVSTLNYVLAGIIVVSLMYFLIIVLLICSSNMVF